MTEKQIRRRAGIGRKVTLIICLSTLIVMSMGIALGYLFGSSVLRGMVGDIHRKLSQLLASGVAQNFEAELVRLNGYAGEPLWKNAGIGGTDRLKAIVSEDSNIIAITLSDRSGGIVAASEDTAGSYSAGDKWAAEFFSDQKRDVFVGDIEFDAAPNEWVIPVSFPVRGADGGVLGVFKAKLPARKLFSQLANFRIDRTGHAVVIDARGAIIFHPGVTQTNVILCGEKDYDRLLTSRGRYATIYEQSIHKKRVFAAFSEVVPPALLNSGKVWRVLVVEDSEEVFAPLRRIAPWVLAAILSLLIVMVIISFVFSGILVRPIDALYAAAVEIMKGNWDYKIDVRTDDEIGQFAEAFKEMISTIKNKQEELLKAKGELEKLSKSLEEKVQVRTADLIMARDKIEDYAEELKAALAAKSEFIATASRELRTPLTAIKEGIDLVLGGKTGAVGEQQKEFLDIAKRNIDRLGRLINNILDFHKMEQGRMEMRARENDINQTVKEVCQIMSHLTDEKKLELIMNLAEDVPALRFDKDKITQVLTNILNNAVKFTDRGSITVSTLKDGNTVRVSVADTGIGIKKSDLSQMFRKFTQLDHGLERKTGGTGLGLAISKEIIEMHGGKIWVRSKAGEGTTFHFVLPIKERRSFSNI